MKKTPSAKSTAPAPNYSFTLNYNPEAFRVASYIGILVMFLVAVIVNIGWVHVDPETTTIYSIFGFNHDCNLLDHEPSRTISAMLLPFWQVPFLLYIGFNFLRIRDAVKENKVPGYIYTLVKIFLPFELLFTIWFALVFVWSPVDNFSFVMHYLPYIGFQVLLALIAIENVLYFDAVKTLPFNNNRNLAIGYLIVLIVTTIVYVGLGLPAAFGLLTIKGTILQPIAQTISQLIYPTLIVPIPLAVAIMEMRRSPNHSITFA